MTDKIQRSDDDDEVATDDSIGPPVPPDGGWGWVIVFSSFIMNVLVDGVCFSAGIFYLEFLDYYRESKGKTAWVGSTLNGMYLTMGPIAGGLANKFGCRAVSIAGSLLAAASFFASTFSPNVDALIVLYGGLGGAGFGLMYLPAIVMVGFYFEKKRALATGIAVCGSGIGAFVFAPFCRYLIDTFTWKGATWIISGIVLNGVVMGALFRPLEGPPRRKKQQLDDTASLEETTDLVVKQRNEGGNRTNGISKPKHDDPKSILYRKHKEKFDQNGFGDGANENIAIQSNLDLSQTNKQLDTDCKRMCRSTDCIYEPSSSNHKQEAEIRQKYINKPMYRKDIFYSGSVTHLPEFKEDSKAYHKSITNVPSEGRNDRTKCGNICGSIIDIFKTMFDFSLMKNPVFVLYGLSCFLCMTGFFVPFIYLPDHAQAMGVSKEQAAFLISILGIANTIGRIMCGWVSDQPWADCLIINNIALICGGSITIVLPFFLHYGLLATYSVVFGLGIAVFVSLRSIIMVELIGLERLTNSFGLVTLCQGLSSFLGAPLAGFLFDVTGNYTISFYVAGSTVALAGVICIPLRRIAKWQDRRERLTHLKEIDLS
ncbi:unnamed protein product [Owenia fusiformis]|uniref:Uncharacterized protein n=1 Tax=Owenia fusiformis TaxID=6347 RepID=A0A8J1XTB1_OWEFU|nr:unnamed protein product [Owenia fusiformis]